jgi:signal transduction histidine kinase
VGLVTTKVAFRRSIQAKLIGLTAIVLAVVVAALAYYFPSEQIASLRRDQLERVSRYGDVFAKQLRSAIAFSDQETAREVLSALDSDVDLAAAALFDAQGDVLYQRGRAGEWIERARRGVVAQRVFHYRDRAAVVTPIASLEGPQGTLVIEVSQTRLNHRQHMVMIKAATLGSLVLLFGFAAVWLVVRSFVRRLQHIGSVATAIAHGETHRLVEIESSDEIAVLAVAFNQMVEQLASERDRLEERVIQRTVQLEDANIQLREEMKQRSAMELELRHAQKLQSVGRLAAGVAHEINTPIQFVGDSVQFIDEAISDVVVVLSKQRDVVERVLAGEAAVACAAAAVEAFEQYDMQYLLEELPQAAGRALDGVSRVGAIVQSMKVFSHQHQGLTLVDINQVIVNTLTIARNEYKYVADVETDYGDIPLVSCQRGEINQVLLNIVLNAAQAIADATDGDRRGRISIATKRDGDCVVVSIADTGGGIPDEIRDRVFEPFFTTKEVGKGTGQGLAIAHSVIVDKHGGSLMFDSTPGVGTTFHIRLPIKESKAVGQAA